MFCSLRAITNVIDPRKLLVIRHRDGRHNIKVTTKIQDTDWVHSPATARSPAKSSPQNTLHNQQKKKTKSERNPPSYLISFLPLGKNKTKKQKKTQNKKVFRWPVRRAHPIRVLGLKLFTDPATYLLPNFWRKICMTLLTMGIHPVKRRNQ